MASVTFSCVLETFAVRPVRKREVYYGAILEEKLAVVVVAPAESIGETT